MPNPLMHFELPGDDPEQMAEFYRRLFDWKIEKVPGDFDYWTVETGPTNDQGMPTEPGTINGGLTMRMAPEQQPINYIGVDDVDTYVARAAELGATIAMGKTEVPGMGVFAQIIDLEGNMLGLWQDTTPQG